ncbi:hypothetical protein BACCIP111899_03754 [Bacillus rhizoplanae]|uniref:DUF4083 domain-containing protein n=1 Tax=Bacillus rhizoplanae TaxID=2880966 RepID=A0ABM8YFP8_9BACI|nr:DUF4083 family protein [Bacillus rhizoplanae]CAG9614521.1 hypothetical protein BACCIP111899_03754 [Bacillus rhizoplanae]
MGRTDEKMDIFSALNIISIILFFGLILLFFVSLGAFIRSRLINQSSQRASLVEIEKKLDKIIGMLEEKK